MSSAAKSAVETTGAQNVGKHRAKSRGVSKLMYAAQQGNVDRVRKIIRDQSSSLFDRDRTGKSALHYCCTSDNICAAHAADLLVMAAPDLVEGRDEDGFTPLHLAVIAGNIQLVTFLIANNADVNAVDNEKHTVVHWATVCGETAALRAVLAAGAPVSTPDVHGGYPLHYAAQMCGGATNDRDSSLGMQVLQTLLSHSDIVVSVADGDKRQPLLWAASAGSAKAVLALVRAGAAVEAPDKDGLTALHCAASRGHTDCLDTLLTLCGASPDVIDSNGCTALHYAVTLGHADATALLLAHGADPNRQDRKGRSPPHCGCAKGQFETVKLIGSHRANLWLRNARGDLPLHEAAASGRRDLVKWLLEMRPSQVNARNNDGRCPLHMAALNDNADMCKILLDAGAHVNPILRTSKNTFMTPLDCALQRGFRSTAKYLQLHGGAPANRLGDQRVQTVNSSVALQIRDDVTFWGDTSSDSERENGEIVKSGKRIQRKKLSHKYERKRASLSGSDLESGRLTSSKLENLENKSKRKLNERVSEKRSANPESVQPTNKRSSNKMISSSRLDYNNEIIINGKTEINIHQTKEIIIDKEPQKQDKVKEKDIPSETTVPQSTSAEKERRPRSAKYSRVRDKSTRSSAERVTTKASRDQITSPETIIQQERQLRAQHTLRNQSTNTSEETAETVIENKKAEMPTPKEEMETLFKEEYKTIGESKRLLDQHSLISNTSEDVEVQKNFIVEASIHAPPKAYEESQIEQKVQGGEADQGVSNEVQEKAKPIALEVEEGDKPLKEQDPETDKVLTEQNEATNTVEPKESDAVLTEAIKEAETSSMKDDNVSEKDVKGSDTPTNVPTEDIVDVKERTKEVINSESQVEPNSDELKPNGQDPALKTSETMDDKDTDAKSIGNTEPIESKNSEKTVDPVEGLNENKHELRFESHPEQTIETKVDEKEPTDLTVEETVQPVETDKDVESGVTVKPAIPNDATMGNVAQITSDDHGAEKNQGKEIGTTEAKKPLESSLEENANNPPKSIVITENKVDGVNKSNKTTEEEETKPTQQVNQVIANDSTKVAIAAPDVQKQNVQKLNDKSKTCKSEEPKKKKQTLTKNVQEKSTKKQKDVKEGYSEEEYSSHSVDSSLSTPTRKTHKSFRVLDEEEALDSSKSKRSRTKGSARKGSRSRSEENKTKKTSKDRIKIKNSKIPTPLAKTSLSKSDRHLDKTQKPEKKSQSTLDARVPSLPNIHEGKGQLKEPPRSESNMSAPLLNSLYSDNERDTNSDVEADTRSLPRSRKRVKKRSKTREARSAGSDYESSNLIDSGFEPSPRSTRIPKWKNMSERGVNMTSVTQSIQTNIRRYHLERKIFQHLLELKRHQIRAGQHNEAVLVKRAIDAYHQSCASTVGAGRYIPEDFTFKSFERFLYESLRKLQKSDVEYMKGLPDAPSNPLLCTRSTNRCMHATHAYTGVPCAAYLPRVDHHTIPKIGFSNVNCKPGTGFLPNITSNKKAVTLELSHGADKQVISLPTDRLDQNKRYYVTFTVKGRDPSPTGVDGGVNSANGHRHSKSD